MIRKQIIRQGLENLPVEFREVVVLRELEGLSYIQIAEVADIPPGTVMSQLANARKRLEEILKGQGAKEMAQDLMVKAS